MSFDHLGLSPELIRAVADQGYTIPTPVQEQAIPIVLAGRDLLAAAQTGTGKTAAFVLPMLELLHGRPPAPGPRPPIRALVLTPTRELALQVEESIRTYGAHRRIRSTTIYGGVGFDPQVRALRSGPGIVVATPGRLLDHVEHRTIDLSQVEILVLDEADRMLDMGFIQPIRRILSLLPRQRQSLLFSATFSDDVRQLAAGLLMNPASVDVAPRNTPAELVSQLVITVDRERKRQLLSHLITSGRIDQALVFTRTKHGANRLALQLAQDGIVAAAIHGNKSQAQRVRALADLKAGRVAVLVATDIAARGIDIESLPHVVNYELPMVPSDYVHRIGRTGRAGVDGEAISLVCVDEAPLLREIEGLLKTRIPSETVAGFEPDRSIRAEPIRLRSAGISVRQGIRPTNGSRSMNASRSMNPARPVNAGRPASGQRPMNGTRFDPGMARPTEDTRSTGPLPRPWDTRRPVGGTGDPGLGNGAGRPFEPGSDAPRRDGRPTGPRPAGRNGWSDQRPAGVGFGNQPPHASDHRGRGPRPGGRPGGQRPGGPRPAGPRPAGARPGGPRPAGARPAGARPGTQFPGGQRPAAPMSGGHAVNHRPDRPVSLPGERLSGRPGRPGERPGA